MQFICTSQTTSDYQIEKTNMKQRDTSIDVLTVKLNNKHPSPYNIQSHAGHPQY